MGCTYAASTARAAIGRASTVLRFPPCTAGGRAELHFQGFQSMDLRKKRSSVASRRRGRRVIRTEPVPVESRLPLVGVGASKGGALPGPPCESGSPSRVGRVWHPVAEK